MLLGLVLSVSGCDKESSQDDQAEVGNDFLSAPDLYAIAGESYVYRAHAEVPDAQYQLLERPTGMTVEQGLGELRWTPDSTQGGAHQVVIRASGNGQVIEQSFELHVGVPRLVAEGQVSSDGGVLEAEGLRVRIPAGVLEEATTLRLSLLEEGTPPLWEEMNMLNTPFIVRAVNSEVRKLPMTVERVVKAPSKGEVYLARETSEAMHLSAIPDGVLVIDPTNSGPTEGEVTAHFLALQDYVDVTMGYLTHVAIQVKLFHGPHITVGFAHIDPPTAAEELQAQTVLTRMEAARAAAVSATMGCEAPPRVTVYIVKFKQPTTVLGVYKSQSIILNKSIYSEKSIAWQITTENHEFFHAIQETMLDDSVLWWREAMAEHGAEEMSNQNVSHEVFAPFDESLTRIGLAPGTGGHLLSHLHAYRLYLYFRFLTETQQFQVCELMRNEDVELLSQQFYMAMGNRLGMSEFAQSFLEFTEAFLFFRDNSNFGDDAPGIGIWAPPSISFTSDTAYYDHSAKGGMGVKVERSSGDSQNIAVSIAGAMVHGDSPIGLVRDPDKVELASFAGESEAEIVLKDVSVTEFYISLSKADVADLANDGVRIEVTEFELLIDNLTATETSEDGEMMMFEVTLSASPGNTPFTFSVTSSDPSEATVDTEFITFTKDNWDQAEVVEVLGVADDEEDGDVAYVIKLDAIEPVGWEVSTEVPLVNKEGVAYVVGIAGIDPTGLRYNVRDISDSSDVPSYGVAVPENRGGVLNPESYFAQHMEEYDMYMNGVPGFLSINRPRGVVNGGGQADFLYFWGNAWSNLPGYLVHDYSYLEVQVINGGVGVGISVTGAGDVAYMENGGEFSFEARHLSDDTKSLSFSIALPNSTIMQPRVYNDLEYRITNTVGRFFKSLNGPYASQFEVVGP